MRQTLRIISALWAAAGISAAADPLDPLVHQLVARHRHSAPALVVGVVQGDLSCTWGFGTLEPGGLVPAETAIFELGSVSKAFTGIALAVLSREGLVSEADSVAHYLPERARATAGRVGAIRLVELASHSSGLPRLPPNFLPRDMTDPYAEFDEGELYVALARIAPTLRGDGRYEYSNLGAGLLGHLLARAAGVSYGELVRDRIAGPLGLSDTRVGLDPALEARLTPPHDRAGAPSRRWQLGALGGAGAVHGSARDLLRLIAAHWGPEHAPLTGALRSAARPRLVVEGTPLAVGLGWHLMVEKGWTIHNGQTGGYHAFLGFDLTRRLGVVVLANAADERYTQLGLALLAAVPAP